MVAERIGEIPLRRRGIGGLPAARQLAVRDRQQSDRLAQ